MCFLNATRSVSDCTKQRCHTRIKKLEKNLKFITNRIQVQKMFGLKWRSVRYPLEI